MILKQKEVDFSINQNRQGVSYGRKPRVLSWSWPWYLRNVFQGRRLKYSGDKSFVSKIFLTHFLQWRSIDFTSKRWRQAYFFANSIWKEKNQFTKKTCEGKGWISLTFQKRNLIREMSFAILTILKKIGSNGL